MSDAIREKALLDSQALIIELLPNDNQRDLSISKSTGWLCTTSWRSTMPLTKSLTTCPLTQLQILVPSAENTVPGLQLFEKDEGAPEARSSQPCLLVAAKKQIFALHVHN